MKLNLDEFTAQTHEQSGVIQHRPKQKIKQDQVEIDFILTFAELPQFWFSLYFPEDVSEPEALMKLFESMDTHELKELIKVSLAVYTQEHQPESLCDWVVYDSGKRWFNQDKNKYIEKPE